VKRLFLGMAIAGGIIVFLGLVVLGSTLWHPEETETRTLGMLLTAFGAMAVSVPLYLEARRIQSALNKSKQDLKRKGASRCAACGEDVASFLCTSHSIGLCLKCIPDHHDPARCLYKPVLQRNSASSRGAKAHSWR